MTERSPDDEQPINAGPERAALARACAERVRSTVEDAGWFLRSRVAWPVGDAFARLGTRGAIGVFGGGGIATAGVIAAIAIAGAGGSGSTASKTEAFVAPPAPAVVLAPTSKPQEKVATKPSGPTLHGAPPSFAPAQDVHSGVADGKALGRKRSDAVASSAADEGPAARSSSTGAGDAPASTAKIGATPEASALATSQAGALDQAEDTGAPGLAKGAGDDGLATPPAPKAAKLVARHFAEAFVAYEIGQTDSGVRKAFRTTGTKQLSKSLLKRPPRQPDGVEVPRAKVVNVVAGPSRGTVYSVSVSLLRVGTTSELRLQMERGVGKKWQVTNVLG